MLPPRHLLPIEPLTAEAFRPYGEVIEAGAAATQYAINRGNAVRYHDLARLDLGAEGGRPTLSLFRAKPQALPLQLLVVERHPLGSQAFMPLGQHPYLVVVAPPGTPPQPDALRCFRAQPGQGVNYTRGTWHHPLLALKGGDFLVIDRDGPPLPPNCDEHPLHGVWIEV